MNYFRWQPNVFALERTMVVYIIMMLERTMVVYIIMMLERTMVVYIIMMLERTMVVYIIMMLERTMVVYIIMMLERTMVVCIIMINDVILDNHFSLNVYRHVVPHHHIYLTATTRTRPMRCYRKTAPNTWSPYWEYAISFNATCTSWSPSPLCLRIILAVMYEILRAKAPQNERLTT